MKSFSRIMLLYDFYGNLLTEKQRKYFDAYYFQDLSLSEIATMENVSKNAVYDSLKKVLDELENFESKTNHISYFLKRMEIYKEISDKKILDKLLAAEVINLWKKQ